MSAMGNLLIDIGERVSATLNIVPEWGDQLVERYAERADEAMAAAVADGILDVSLLAQCAAEAVVDEFHAEAHSAYGEPNRLVA